MIAAHKIVRHLLENEEEDDVIWKRLTPDPLEDDRVLPYLRSLYNSRGMELIGEAEGSRTATLAQLFRDNEPEQWVLDMGWGNALDTPILVREVDPKKLLLLGEPLPKRVKEAKIGPTWKIVKAYMKNPGDPIVIDGNEVLDGHHRAMAAYLSKRSIMAVNVKDLLGQ